MTKQFLRCAVVGLAMALGACFESVEPLIMAGAADFPFDKSVRYTFYEWDKEKNTWQASETGTINRDGDHYVQLDDGGLVKEAKPFLLKSIGNGFFVGQQPNNMAFMYDLLRIQGDIVYQYGMACADADKKYADQGLLDGFMKDTQWGNTCSVSSFDKLARVLRAIADERPQPQGMFGLVR